MISGDIYGREWMGLFFRETQLQSEAVGIAFLPGTGQSPSSCEGEKQYDPHDLLPEGHLYCKNSTDIITLILHNNSVRSAGYTISHMRKLRIREVESFS